MKFKWVFKNACNQKSPAWTIKLNLVVEGKLENIIGNTNFNIINISGSELFDPDQDDSWNPEGSNYSTSSKTLSIIGGVFGSLAVIGIIVTAIFGLKLHYWNNSKKIK